MANDRRRAFLARIHISQKALSLSDATYRAFLKTGWGVDSAADLGPTDLQEAAEVLEGVQGKHRSALSAAPRPFPPRRPPLMNDPDKGPMLGKIEALLAEAKRPWAYADALARRMFGTERIAWCTSEQLRKIIAALVYDARRHGRPL